MIDANAYQTACTLNKAQVFAVFMKDFEYQAKKEARPKLIQKLLYKKNIMICWM